MHTLREVAKLCPSAGLVWLALCRLVQERDSASLRLSRATLLELSGIQSPRTISTALGALETAGWLSRKALFHRSKAGGVRAHVQVTLHLGAKNDFNLPRCVRRVKDDTETGFDQPTVHHVFSPVRYELLDAHVEGLTDEGKRDLAGRLQNLLVQMERKYQEVCQDAALTPADKSAWLGALLAWDEEAKIKLRRLTVERGG